MIAKCRPTGAWRKQAVMLVQKRNLAAFESEPPKDPEIVTGTKEQATRGQPYTCNKAAAKAHLVNVGKARSPAPGEASLSSAAVDRATQPLLLFDECNLDAACPVRIWAVFPSRPRTSNLAPLAHGLTAAPVIIVLEAEGSLCGHFASARPKGVRDWWIADTMGIPHSDFALNDRTPSACYHFDTRIPEPRVRPRER